ncbi:MAG: cyclic nucleotide-binding domain-containing protein [Bacteroidetes bacterium]|nr:cyclic nucleotide-binding domain-containing protein [Bacteroidota bacterium]
MNTHETKTSGLMLIERVLLLKSLSVFSDTPETILAEIVHLMVVMNVSSGTNIVKEGEVGNCMYIIFDGRVSIHKQKKVLVELREKDFFGELALLDVETRSATATASTDCILFRIDQEPFYDMMESRPEVVRGVIKILCRRIREANMKLLEKES